MVAVRQTKQGTQAKQAKKSTPVLVTITRPWQLVFVSIMLLSQIIIVAQLLWAYARFIHYLSAGTWAFQISTWGYPVMLVIIAWIFGLGRVLGWLPRLFWAVFLATMGVAAFNVVQTVTNMLMTTFHWQSGIGANGTSWWAAFGVPWAEMMVLVVLYTVALGVIARRSKR